MASSPEKTIGLILLIALLALVFVRVTPALFMPLHIMPKFAHLSIPRLDFGCQLSYIFQSLYRGFYCCYGFLSSYGFTAMRNAEI